MRLFRFPMLAACPALIAMPFVFAYGVALRVGYAILDTFQPSPLLLAADGAPMSLSARGTAIDPVTLNSLRHEAGVPRVSAARNT